MSVTTPLPVGFITTWDTHCGIATYSAELIESLDHRTETPVSVLCESAVPSVGSFTPASGESRRPVVACWNRRSPQGAAYAIEQAVQQYELKVVHVQHEFGLWFNERALRDVLSACRSTGAKVVVTIHTTLPYGDFRHAGTLRMLGRSADALIVHTREAQAAVLASGPRAALYCIPHGTKLRATGKREAGLERLNVPPQLWESDVTWGLVFGFQGPGKNIVSTIRAFAEGKARGQVKKSGLLIVGEAKDEYYASRVTAAAMESGFIGVIYKSDSFANGEAVDDIFAAADFGILNHLGSSPMLLSASGQAHLYASYNTPIVCADVPIYSEALRAGAAIGFELDRRAPEVPTLSCINVIAAMSRSRALRSELSNAAAKFATDTRWDRIADMHMKVYEAMLCANE